MNKDKFQIWIQDNVIRSLEKDYGVTLLVGEEAGDGEADGDGFGLRVGAGILIFGLRSGSLVEG